MDEQLNWLLNLGTSLEVEGNKPILITRQETLYLVTAGKVDLFSVGLKEGQPAGRRHFLFQLPTGSLIFPLLPDEDGSRGTLITGRMGTTLQVIDRQDFLTALQGATVGASEEALLLTWLQQLNRQMLTATVPQQFQLIEPEETTLTLEAGNRLRSREPLVWVSLTEGAACLNGDQQHLMIPPGAWVPLMASGWLEMNTAGTLRVMTTQEVLAENQLNSGLSWFHQAFKKDLRHRRQEERAALAQKMKEKELHDQRFVQSALLKLAQVTEKETPLVEETPVAHPLLAACQLVGKAQHIDVPAGIAALLSEDSRDPMGEIARAARFQMRKVVLRDKWYLEDNGPLVTFYGSEKAPVALIPHAPQGYHMHHPGQGTVTKVTEALADDMDDFAYYFYRPFPNKALNAKDLLRFGITASWRRDLVLVVLMGLAGGLLGMLTPVATGIVFDSVIPQGERTQLLQIGFLLGAVALANSLFELTRSLAMLRLEGKMDGSIQAAVWDRLLSLPVPFFKDYSSGELAMRAMGITQIRQAISGIAVNTVLTSIFSVFNFFLLFYYSKRLALFATIPVVISIAVTLGLGYFQVRYERQLVDYSKNIQGLVLQLLGGVAKFRVAGAENRAFHQWAQAFGRQRQTAFKNELVANVLKTFNAFFPLVTSMLIFYMVVSSTSVQLDPGKFIAFNAALATFIGYMTNLSETLITLNAIMPLYDMTKPILEALPEYDEAKGDAGTLTGDIEVSRVSFRYREGAPLVLKDVSFKINEGEYVALVGSSGSGKSTLFRVLLGFEKPETGQVYYNGKDLTKVDIRSVRKQLGVVLQNGQLMQGDIFSNIVGSNPQLTMNDAWEAARMAGFEEDIKSMPMGMHTVISEGASTLSGGQRQRLLIARAIVNKPRIIYFDEATSALDNRTQQIVSQSLDHLSATRIVIAHRLSTIMNCQRIIVMDQGQVVEQGSYEALMAKDGLFAQLARRQLA